MKPYLTILLPALVGAIAGGRWLGMTILVVSAGVAEALDFAAMIVSGSLLICMAAIVYYYAGRTALVIFAATAALSALFGAVFV
jgi:hypothetical protein